MLDSDREYFFEMMGALCEMYGVRRSQKALHIYFNILLKYDKKIIAKAIDSHVRDPQVGQFFPKPADLIREICGSRSDAALEAWSKVERKIKRLGSYSTPDFDDKKISRVIRDMGGWGAICRCNEYNSHEIKKDFESRFSVYAKRQMENESLLLGATYPS